MIDVDSHRQDIDNLIRYTKKLFPAAELYELGAILHSTGGFLICSAIPELREKFAETINISHQLLEQNKHDEDQPSVTESLHTNRSSD